MLSEVKQIDAVRESIRKYPYNASGQSHKEDKKLPLVELMNKARAIQREMVSIQCVEAVFLALLLTHPLRVIRFGISFTSQDETGVKHRHLVLGLKENSCYGALGISRSEMLMSKPMTYPNLWALVHDFLEGYALENHSVLSVTLSEVIPRVSTHVVKWKALKVPFDKAKSAVKRIFSFFSDPAPPSLYGPRRQGGPRPSEAHHVSEELSGE
ncbi:hypothetical protein DIPPA_04764 [Diplonema papillatum]|nr:hypothetical protein DIPPA_04764 [Diplonema papillatum]